MIRYIFIALMLATITGCNADADYYGKVKLVDVSGVIKLDGQPVAGAVVVFEDLKSGLQSYAKTDSSGEYQLRFDSVKHGVIPGEKRVIVSTTLKIPGLDADGEEGEEEGESRSKRSKSKDRIPQVYRGKKTVLRATVGDSNATINFNLKSDGSTKGPG